LENFYACTVEVKKQSEGHSMNQKVDLASLSAERVNSLLREMVAESKIPPVAIMKGWEHLDARAKQHVQVLVDGKKKLYVGEPFTLDHP
jgi:hypothetical protein